MSMQAGDAAGPQRRAPGCGAGFTFVELLTVIAVLAILAAVALPSMAGARESAVRARTKSQFAQWAAALELFHQEYGYLPNVTTGPLPSGRIDGRRLLAALTGRDAAGRPLVGPELGGNTWGLTFHPFGPGDIVDGQVVDAFGNDDIVILVDRDQSGVISGTELVRVGLRSGADAMLLPTPPEEEFAPDGIRASIAFYSAGAGSGLDGYVYSWK